MQELVKLLEIDRVLLKYYNIVVNSYLEEHQALVKQIREERRNADLQDIGSQRSSGDFQSINCGSQKVSTDPTVILLKRVLEYCKESIRFLLQSCFKRWSLAINLLIMLKNQFDQENSFKSSNYHGHANNSSQTGSYDGQTSILLNFLIGSFWWFFKTLMSLVEQSYQYESMGLFQSFREFKETCSKNLSLMQKHISRVILFNNRYYEQAI